MKSNRSDILDWSDQGRIPHDRPRDAPDGEMLLTHLVGENFERLGSPKR